MIDPEQVERLFPDNNGNMEISDNKGSNFVRASDYDQLLEIHLSHINTIIDLFNRCGEPLSAEAIVNLKNGTWR